MTKKIEIDSSVGNRMPNKGTPGRKCRKCGVVLSLYNRNNYCFAHVHDGVYEEYKVKKPGNSWVAYNKVWKNKESMPKKRKANKYPGVRRAANYDGYYSVYTKDGKNIYLGRRKTALGAYRLLKHYEKTGERLCKQR